MFRRLSVMGILLFSAMKSIAEGSGHTIQSVFYCGEDFSMLMSNGERWVVKKSQVGEQKMDHFISIALYMAATNKKTANIFPGAAENWCGNPGTRPITFISFVN